MLASLSLFPQDTHLILRYFLRASSVMQFGGWGVSQLLLCFVTFFFFPLLMELLPLQIPQILSSPDFFLATLVNSLKLLRVFCESGDSQRHYRCHLHKINNSLRVVDVAYEVFFRSKGKKIYIFSVRKHIFLATYVKILLLIYVHLFKHIYVDY